MQQDSAQPHFSNEVPTWLNENFNEKWVGGSGPISSAMRFLDLMLLDVFLLKYIKTKIYKTKVNNIVDSKKGSEQEMKAIKKETLKDLFNSFVSKTQLLY